MKCKEQEVEQFVLHLNPYIGISYLGTYEMEVGRLILFLDVKVTVKIETWHTLTIENRHTLAGV